VSDVLTQEEINALLSAYAKEQSGEAVPVAVSSPGSEGVPTKVTKHVKTWDYRRPERFSKEQIRTLQMLHETYARYASTSLSLLMRMPVKVSLVGIDQATYDEFLNALANPSVIYIFRMPPLEGSAIMEINTGIAFCMIDRMLGGPGKARMRVRELTDIEQTLMRTVVDRLLSDLGSSWVQLAEIQPEYEGYETNPLFAQIVPPHEPVILFAFEIKMGDIFGSLNMCIPYSVIQPITGRLSAQRWFMEPARRGSSRRSQLETKVLEQVAVPVKVELGRCEVTMRDVLNLEVGDIVKLDGHVGDELTLYIGDLPKFRCLPGSERKQLAVQITRLIRPEEVGK